MVLYSLPLKKLGICAMLWILGVSLVVCGDSVVVLRGGNNDVAVVFLGITG